jgi:diguanylate cyclase (GGDEF)-like protein
VVRPRTKNEAADFDAPSGGVRGWDLWSLPRRVLITILTIEAAALAGTVVTALHASPSAQNWARLALLFGLCAVFAEANDRIERVRRYLGAERAWVNATSVWSFAAVLALPAGYAALLVTALFLHTLVRSRRHKSARPHRLAFSGAAIVLSTLAASGALNGIRTVLTFQPAGAVQAVAVLVAIGCFYATNQALVGVVIYLISRPANWYSVLIRGDDLGFEFVTLLLGVLTAECVLHSPWLSPGVLPILALLYRSAMVRQLQVTAQTDSKTGLLTPAAWQDMARTALLRAARLEQPVALLLVDLDHFKQVNDTHGHLTGDRALAEVSACLRRELRGYDAVGRFGGEEFVVLLDDVEADQATEVASRVRSSIATLLLPEEVRITASIGVAVCARADTTLEELLQAADTALYEAKGAGRDQVRTVAHRPIR